MLKGAAGCRRVPMLCFFAGQGCGGSMKKLFLRIFPQTEDAGRGGVFTSFVVNMSGGRPPGVWRVPRPVVGPAVLYEISQCSVSGQGRGGSMKNLHMKFPHALIFPARAAEVV